jgi:tetratricopeptide (TPR) repeat protein
MAVVAAPGYCQSKSSGAKTPAAKTSVAAPDYSKESFVLERREVVERFAADGTADIVGEVKSRVQTDAAVRASGLLEFPYAAKQDTMEVDYVRVEKPDGRVVETPAADIQDLPMQVTREAPFYSDLRVKQVPVKGLSIGDVVEYRIHRKIEHPAAPGEFWDQQSFVEDGVILSDILEIHVPKTKYVKVVSKDVQPEIKEEGDEKVYRWKTAHLDPTVAKPEPKKEKKNAAQPSVELTTFRDWAAVGSWYDKLQKDRVEVTPEIEAKAKSLTRGLTNDEDKIRAIYIYVATQFRYIGVNFGVGRYQPHRASDVLENQYGDCKDKHTLLASLLKAAGYTASPVLVNPAAKLRKDVPSPGQFNHVITLVETGGKSFWMDSTTEVGPFQWLTPDLRGEQGLVIPDSGDAHFANMPDNPPYPAKTTWDTVGTLTKDGSYTGHFDISIRDDWEIIFRAVYRNATRADWDVTTQKLMGAFGFAGTVTHAEPGAPEDLSKPFHLDFDYERKDFGDWDNHRTFPMMPAWFFIKGKGDPEPAEPFYTGMPGTWEFKSSTTVPDGFGATLPASTTLKTAFVDYSNAYSFDKGSFGVDRKFILKSGKLDPSAWAEYLRWQSTVVDNQSNMVQLVAPGDKEQKPDTDSARAQELVNSALRHIQGGDHQAAWRDLDDAKKENPNQAGLWAQYGYLDALDGHFDQAMTAFRKEIDDHPDDVVYNLQLIRTMQEMRRTDDAMELARAIVKSAPANVEAQLTLANLLRANGKTDEAEVVLKKLVSAPNPTDQMKFSLAMIYLKEDRKTDAEPLLKAVLDSSSDPDMLNNAAYELADANLDLELARTATERAISLQEAKAVRTTLDNVSNEDLSTVAALGRFWDTLGWVYFRQGNLATAEAYVKPAWVLAQSQVVGDHLAEIYKRQGKLLLAKETMDLAAMTGARPSTFSPSQTKFHAEMQREAASISGGKHPGAEELSKMRSVELSVRKSSQMSAEFFVLLSAQGIEAAKFISGDEELRAEEKSVMKAKFNAPFPPGSKAHLVRRGVMACSAVIGDCQFVMLLPRDAHAE